MLKIIKYIFLLVIFSCNQKEDKQEKFIRSVVDNVIAGNPIRIEVYNNERSSINIESDSLYKYNSGNTLLFGGVFADLFNKEGNKTSVMYSDSAVVFSNSDSVKAVGSVVVESIKGFKLHAHEIILYNDIKLVKSDGRIMFTSNGGDTLYGKGFWSNFEMTSSKILKPIGHIADFN